MWSPRWGDEVLFTNDIWSFAGTVGVTLLIMESGMHINFEKVKLIGGKAFVVAIIGTAATVEFVVFHHGLPRAKPFIPAFHLRLFIQMSIHKDIAFPFSRDALQFYQCWMRLRPDGSWINEISRWMENEPILVTCYAVMTLEQIHRTFPLKAESN